MILICLVRSSNIALLKLNNYRFKRRMWCKYAMLWKVMHVIQYMTMIVWYSLFPLRYLKYYSTNLHVVFCIKQCMEMLVSGLVKLMSSPAANCWKIGLKYFWSSGGLWHQGSHLFFPYQMDRHLLRLFHIKRAKDARPGVIGHIGIVTLVVCPPPQRGTIS